MGVQAVDFNVWIDAQHQARKVVVTENGAALRMTISEQITGINQPASVALPPAGEVSQAPMGRK